jgi:hypothetical protein
MNTFSAVNIAYATPIIIGATPLRPERVFAVVGFNGFDVRALFQRAVIEGVFTAVASRQRGECADGKQG